MDISYINILSKRHSVNVASLDAEQLKAKVSQETAKLLQNKTIHDSVYWQLRENYQQLEENHERLQQNMVEVQMQYENVSGQYQKEIRLRPETLNKVAYTREQYDVLQGCVMRLKETITRCHTDQAALNDANSKAGQVIGTIKLKQTQLEEKYQFHVHNLEEKLQLVCQERDRLMQIFSAAQEHGSAEMQQLMRKLDTVEGERERLARVAAELPQLQRTLALLQQDKEKLEQEGTKLSNLIERQGLQIKEKDEFFLNMEQHIQQLEKDCTNMKNENFRLLQNLNESQGANASLKHALADQSQASEEMIKQINQLEMQVATVKIDNLKLDSEMKEQNLQLANYKSDLNEENQKLITAMREQTKLQQEIANLLIDFKTLQLAHDDILKELVETKEDFKNKAASFEKNSLEQRLHSEEKCARLATIIETNDKTLNELKMDFNELSEANVHLKQELDEEGSKVQREKEKRNELEREHSRQVKHYELQAKMQEQKIIENSKIISKLKVDKKILEERIINMQNCIDGAHSSRFSQPSLGRNDVPEQDITKPNVAMLTQTQVPLQPQCKKRCMSPRHMLENDNRQTQFDVRSSKASRRGGYPLPYARAGEEGVGGVEGDGDQPGAGSTPVNSQLTTQTPTPSVRIFFKTKRSEAFKRSN